MTTTENPQFTGPRYRDGLIELGPYVDQPGEYTARLWTSGETGYESDGSAWSTAVVGATGTGKSRVAESFTISAVSSGLVTYWYCDPNAGASSPALAANADWFVKGDDADKMLLPALERISWVRMQENATNGWIGFRPTTERPLLLVVIDEADQVFRNVVTAERWAAVLYGSRKVGISILTLSRRAHLAAFGCSEPLRAALIAGNGIGMWTATAHEANFVGLHAPDRVPHLPGYAVGSEIDAAGEKVWRNRLVSNAGEWLAKYTQPALDTLTAKAAGEDYANRHGATAGGAS